MPTASEIHVLHMTESSCISYQYLSPSPLPLSLPTTPPPTHLYLHNCPTSTKQFTITSQIIIDKLFFLHTTPQQPLHTISLITLIQHKLTHSSSTTAEDQHPTFISNPSSYIFTKTSPSAHTSLLAREQYIENQKSTFYHGRPLPLQQASPFLQYTDIQS